MLRVHSRCSLLLILLALLPVANAAAQEFNPITTDDLDRYLQQLSASDEQRMAAFDAHERYMHEYKAIREGAIAEYWAREMERRFPDVAEQRHRHRLVERIERQIAAVDASFFDALEPSLSEEQLSILPRVRMMRQRDRLPKRSMDPDLIRVVQDVDLPPAMLAAIEPILLAYEPPFTRAMEERERQHRAGELIFSRRVEEAGLGGEPIDSPESFMALDEISRAARAERRELTDAADRELRRINDRTIEQMVALADDPIADRILIAYYTTLHRSKVVLDSNALAALNPAAEHPELSPEQRKAAAELRDDLRAALRSGLREQIAEWDNASRLMRKERPADWFTEHRQRMAAIEQGASEAEQRAMAELESLLTPEQLAMVRAIQEPPAPREPTPAERQQEHRERREQALMFLPPPIGADDVNVYLARLGVDENPPVELRRLHEQYVAQYRHSAQQASRELQQARQALGPATPLEEREAAHRLHDRKLDELRAIDARFFDDVADHLDADAEPARAMRRRHVDAAIHHTWFRDAPPVDVVAILLREVQPPPAIDDVEHLLALYEREIAPRLRLAADRTLAFMRHRELMEAFFELRRQLPEDERPASPARPFDAGDMPRPIIEARRLNRRTVDQIAAILSHEKREQFVDAYRRFAAPDAAIDEGDPAAIVRRALESPDLTQSQRERLATLLAEHQAEHRRVTIELVDATLNARQLADEWWAADRESRDNLSGELRKAQDAQRRLQGEREELNARTNQRAEVILGHH